MEWDDIGTVDMRGECVMRGKVLNVWQAALMVHVSVLDYGELLSSCGCAEWSKVWFVTWGIVPVGPRARCSHLITQVGSSVCMSPKAGYMCFGLWSRRLVGLGIVQEVLRMFFELCLEYRASGVSL